MKIKREDIRNIAIIAHVDHGKTTLVDELLKQSGVFRSHQVVQERVMDSNDIERERGITILSKNTAVFYKNTKINIIDTPGHADFGGEVERVLKMVDGVVLVVDAFEGPMPQTKFVLKKALELDLAVIVCINKIDRPEARADEVIDEVLELLIDLDANDEQLECPFVYASAKSGIAMLELGEDAQDMQPLFETIINHIPAPEGDPDEATQVLISTIDYNEYVGRIGVGKVSNGSISVNQEAIIVNAHEPEKFRKVKISKLYEFDGLNKIEVNKAGIGSIVAISGIADIHIGDTLCSTEKPEPMTAEEKELLKERIIAVLGTVYDPEIPVDIYKLGLIYEINIDDDANVHILMTVTAPNCPVADQLPMQVKEKVSTMMGVKKCKVELTFEPAWNPSMMSEEARAELGFDDEFGY